MLIEDLLKRSPAVSTGAPAMDALIEPNVLQEAQLLDARVLGLTSTIGLLLDLRVALQLRHANTAVLVARGVQRFSWSAEARQTKRTAWNIVGSTPAYDGGFSLSLSFFPRAALEFFSEHAEIYIGDVPGLVPVPPDYGADDEERIEAGLASWRSPFEIVEVCVSASAGD